MATDNSSFIQAENGIFVIPWRAPWQPAGWRYLKTKEKGDVVTAHWSEVLPTREAAFAAAKGNGEGPEKKK